MSEKLTDYELQQIRKKLPPKIQALKDKYPQTVYTSKSKSKSKKESPPISLIKAN